MGGNDRFNIINVAETFSSNQLLMALSCMILKPAPIWNSVLIRLVNLWFRRVFATLIPDNDEDMAVAEPSSSGELTTRLGF